LLDGRCFFLHIVDYNEWAALLVVLSLFLLPAFESATLFEFHSVSMAPTLLLAALFFLDTGLLAAGDRRGIWQSSTDAPEPAGKSRPHLRLTWVLASIFFLLAIGTKEDVSSAIAVLGLYFILTRRWRIGAALFVLGVGWFLVATYLIVPGSRPDGTQSAYLGFFSEFGQTPVEILTSPIREPGKVIGLLLSRKVVSGLGMLLIPLALMPLIGWRMLIISAPVLAIPLLSGNPMMSKLETYHYASPTLAFLMLAAVDGILRSSSVVDRLTAKQRGRGQAAGASGSVHRDVTGRRNTSVLWIALFVVLVGLVYHVYRGYSPLALPYHWPQVTPHDKIGDELAASIPKEAPVLAQAELVPLVARRPWVRIWHGPFDAEAEYVFLDVSHPKFTNRHGAQERLLADFAFDPSFGLVNSVDGYLLLRRGADRVATSPEFFTFVLAEPGDTTLPVNAVFGNELRLSAYEAIPQINDREGEPLVYLYWDVLEQPSQDYFISVFLLDDNQMPVGATLQQQPATVWWPTSRWEKGATIRVLANTFPWWTGDRDVFWYGLAVTKGSDPWDLAARLPVATDGSGPAPVDGDTLLPLVKFRRLAGIPYAEQ
jgi:uncharacterized membrane protein